MSKVSKFLIALVAFLGFIIVLINVLGAFGNRITTKVASIGKIEKNIETEGYIVRDEYVIFSRNGCFIDSAVSEGERVSKGEYLATVYENGTDSTVYNDIKMLNERILSLEKLTIAEGGIHDVQETDNFLKSKILSVIEASHKGNGVYLNDVYYELVNNIDENSASDNNSVRLLINKLKEEKAHLESSLSGEKTTLFADSAGLYFSSTDGYETILYPEMISDLTVSAYNQLPDNFEVNEEKASAKLVTGYDWYYTFLVDESYADDFEYASVITINFDEHSDEDIKAYVYNISQAENGKCVVTCRIEKYVHYAFANRKIPATIVLDSTEGIKIPRQAVRVVEGQTGVYISKHDLAKFRTIKIIAQDEDYVVVSEGIEGTDNLMVYDEVIVKGNIKTDGQLIE